MCLRLARFFLILISMCVQSAHAVELVSSSLPDGREMEPYSVQLGVTNQLGPLEWWVTSGDLPAGLTLSQSGLLGGVPELGGTYLFDVTVYDFGSQLSDFRTYELTIASNINRRPVIWATAPDVASISLPESTSRLFRVYAYDPEALDLAYEWRLNGSVVGINSDRYTFSSTWGDAGTYLLRVEVSDDLWDGIVHHEWMIHVDSDNNDNGIPNVVEIDLGRDPNEPLPAGVSAAIDGTILGGGAPLEGARVQLSGTSGRVYHEVVSDSDGRYAIRGIIPGEYFVAFRAEGFADSWYAESHQRAKATRISMGSAEVRSSLDAHLQAGQSPAYVEVTSDPSGAAIYLNYLPVNQITPAVVDVGEIGSTDVHGNIMASHVLSLSLPGHPMLAPKAVPAIEGDTVSVHFDYAVTEVGSLHVDSSPAGAEVFLNAADSPKGTTPILVENLAPGSHTLLLRSDGYLRPRPVIAAVVANTTNMVSVPLVPNEGTNGANVTVRSSESDAEIYLNYLNTEMVTDAIIDMVDPASHSGQGWRSASHVVMLRKPGLRTFAPRYVSELTDGSNIMQVPVDPLTVATTRLLPATYDEAYSNQLYAAGGGAPYAWTEVPTYREEANANSFSLSGHRWRSGMDEAFLLDLPFAFPFFGGTHTNCYVDTHGVIRFGEAGSDWSPGVEKFRRTRMIAAMWEDFLSYGDEVQLYLDKTAERVIIRWYANNDLNCAATLYPDGRVRFQYGEGNEYVGLIGVSSGDGSSYALASRSSAISMNRADDILFSPESNMPIGITLSSEGVLTGAPQFVGSRDIAVAVSDAYGAIASKVLSLEVAPNPFTSTISGTIRGDGIALSGAFIEFRDSSNTTLYRSVTSTNGTYLLESVSAGPYYVKVGAPFYAHKWFDEAAALAAATPYYVPVDSVISDFDFNLISGSNTSVLEVISSPPGAAIFVDYWPSGKTTPALIELGESGDWDSQGFQLASRVISLRHPNAPRPQPVSVNPVQAETVPVIFELSDASSGSLFIDSQPQNAEVYVGYASAMDGYTPVLVDNLAPGTHTVLLRRPGYLQPRPIRATVSSGETNRLFVPLNRMTAETKLMAEVRSAVDDVPVFVDYLPTGLKTDTSISFLDPASHAGVGWHSASHVIQLRPSDRLASAPRYVPESLEIIHEMVIPLSVDPISVVDTNNDGIPDWWCNLYDLDPRDPYLADKKDGSGMTYMEKYLAGLIPNDPASSLVMTGFDVSGPQSDDKSVRFRLDTVPGKMYLIQSQPNLGDDSWTNITEVFTATTSNAVVEVNTDAQPDQSYYRLILVVP